jgi:lactoylglutathione lyase
VKAAQPAVAGGRTHRSLRSLLRSPLNGINVGQLTATTMLGTLEYVVLRCADLERSRRFYEALGLRPEREQHGRGPEHYSCDLGGVVLELYPLGQSPTSGVRLGIRVRSVGETVESLRQIGAAILRVKADEQPASAVVRDPDGHEIALTEEP